MNDNLLDKFTGHFKQILIRAQNVAWQKGAQNIEPLHLLYALLEQKGSIATEILAKQNLKTADLQLNLNEPLTADKLLATNPWDLPQPNEASQHIIEQAVKVAYEFGHKYVGSEHLLSSLINNNDRNVQAIFLRYTIDVHKIGQQLELILRGASKFSSWQQEQGDTRDLENRLMGDNLNNQESILEQFTTDLTTKETQEKIDPVIGRAAEIERLIQILSRRTKNNPILLGDAGVGKTAIIEGLAKKIVAGEVPDVLLDKKIICLDLSAVIAGTMYRGEFESRLKKIIDEVKNNPQYILFIDEIHNIIGAGATSGSLDAANILKPALARGQLRCIGATTREEYKKFIENDKALERRFQPIIVEEASETETLEILRGIQKNYETYHRVNFTPEALETSIALSQRYMPDKKLPDKAIDLLDEAASSLRVAKEKNKSIKIIRDLEHQLEGIRQAKKTAILAENFASAINLKDQEEIITQELQSLRTNQTREKTNILGIITAERIAAIVARATGIPVTEILQSERRKLLHLEKYLQKELFGQEDALKIVADTIRRARAGLSDPNRPLASFIFMGPSGVGKTETARLLARLLFDNPNALIRVDMSEFAESFNASKLIGAPAGYVGYKDVNVLTDAVKAKPYSIVLFDEIEKAHPDIFNLLLQVLEDGRLTDAAGRIINFRNTIIIMTSNIGLDQFNAQAALGFEASEQQEQSAEAKFEQTSEQIRQSLHDYFRPEFLNRIDKVVVFKPLTKSAAKKIIQAEIEKLRAKLASRQITFDLDAGTINYLANEGFKVEEGARSLKRFFQEHITNVLAEQILGAETSHHFQANIQDKRIVVTQ
ncbi:MAG: ATP-dependent Clp protease ATP-binding subunit [Candidatus Komeilibacteria bacterium]